VISGWPRELEQLSAELKKAAKRKVYIVLFSHSALPATLPGELFSYELDEGSLEDFWKHRLVVVADDTRSLIAATEQGNDDNAVVSETARSRDRDEPGRARHHAPLPAHQRDVQQVMARMLGAVWGAWDSLLSRRRPAKARARAPVPLPEGDSLKDGERRHAVPSPVDAAAIGSSGRARSVRRSPS